MNAAQISIDAAPAKPARAASGKPDAGRSEDGADTFEAQMKASAARSSGHKDAAKATGGGEGREDGSRDEDIRDGKTGEASSRTVSLLALIAALGDRAPGEAKGAAVAEGEGGDGSAKGAVGGAASEAAAARGEADLSVAGKLSAKAGTRVDFVSLRTDYQPASAASAGTMLLEAKLKAGASEAADGAQVGGEAHGAGTVAKGAGEADVVGARALAAVSVGATGATPAEPKTSASLANGAGAETVAAIASVDGQKSAGRGEAGSRDGRSSGNERGAARLEPAIGGTSGLKADAAASGEKGADTLSGQVAAALSARLAAATKDSSGDAGSAPSGAPAAPARGGLVLRAGGAALQTLQIQLQPETLGKLDVTMKLVAGQLAIHLVASEAATALRLREDADGLRSLLKTSGFSVDDAAITVAARDAGHRPMAATTVSQDTSADGGARSFDQGSAGFGQGAGGREQNEGARPSIVFGTRDERSAPEAGRETRLAAGAVYL